ncbi:hypothetical protein J4444_05380 [Candidatus Woesearchaeota archaeon]|nr:hypothetical protein [Candidatus Woesearchaeota archaeon]
MTEENAKTEPKLDLKNQPSERGLFNFIKKHPYLTGIPVVLISGYIGLRMTAAPYSEVSLGVVQEEVMLPHSSDQKSEKKGEKHYTLTIQLQEEVGANIQERICRFYIAENEEMPVDVLEDMIIPGSEIYVPNLTNFFFSKPTSRYQIGCHGRIESNVVRVVHPGDSSEVVRRSLEAKLDEVRQEERTRARQEIMFTKSELYF